MSPENVKTVAVRQERRRGRFKSQTEEAYLNYAMDDGNVSSRNLIHDNVAGCIWSLVV